jgi:hypothetical protein
MFDIGEEKYCDVRLREFFCVSPAAGMLEESRV